MDIVGDSLFFEGGTYKLNIINSLFFQIHTTLVTLHGIPCHLLQLLFGHTMERPRLAPGYTPPISKKNINGINRRKKSHVVFLDSDGTNPSTSDRTNVTTVLHSTKYVKPKVAEPPKYDGSYPAEDWLELVVHAANTNKWKEDSDLVKHAITYLQGKAYKAYKLLVNTNRLKSTDDASLFMNETFKLSDGSLVKNVTWESFVKHMKIMFPRSTGMTDTKMILEERRQVRGEKFGSYAVEKMDLCSNHDPEMSVRSIILHLISGALPEIRDKLEEKEDEIFAKPEDEQLEYFLQLANRIARFRSDRGDILEDTKRIHEGLLATMEKIEANAKSLLKDESNQKKNEKGFKVNSGYKDNVPRKYTPRGTVMRGRWTRFPTNIKCFHCGKLGHIARNCASKLRGDPPTYNEVNAKIATTPSAPQTSGNQGN